MKPKGKPKNIKSKLKVDNGLIIMVLFLVAIFSKNYLIKITLKKYGLCKLGELTNEEIGETRARSSFIKYEFIVNGETYDGASDIVDPAGKRKGEKICIIYLPAFPYIHRPTSFFEESINCNCK